MSTAEPQAQRIDDQKKRTAIKDMIGLTLRVYTTGSAITQDYRTDRVNIEVDESDRIVDVWFG